MPENPVSLPPAVAMAGERIVVMGVSGSGKTVIGTALAAELERPFLDADALHPAHNVELMAAGIPLTDDDRWPWLDAVGAAMRSRNAVVMACSALKRSYRDRLRAIVPDLLFVELDGTPALLAERIGHRRGHFMPPSLLESQIETLESLTRGESGFIVDVAGSVDEVVATIVRTLKEQP